MTTTNTTPEGIDLDKLEALARNRFNGGLSLSPAEALELIAVARAAQQHAMCQPASAMSQPGAPSIDTAEFRNLLGDMLDAYRKEMQGGPALPYELARPKLIAHIDSVIAAAAQPAPDYGMENRDLARRILVFMGRATSGSNEPGSDPLADRLAEKLAGWIKPAPAVSEPAPTDLSKRLRTIAAAVPKNDPALVTPKCLTDAADEIDRYYGGMLNWKRTAEKKDRDYNAERIARGNERCAARAAVSEQADELPPLPERPKSMAGRTLDYSEDDMRDYARAALAHGASSAPADGMYSRADVQKWRDDLAHAAADMVKRAMPAFGEGDWSWLVSAIQGLAASPTATPASASGPLVRESAWTWEQRAQAAESFLRDYADTNMEKLLGDYEAQPIVRRLAVAILEWQQAAFSQATPAIAPQAPAVDSLKSNPVDAKKQADVANNGALQAQVQRTERDGWDAAAKALAERAAGHDRQGNWTEADECRQCASMLHDMKPGPQPIPAQPGMPASAQVQKPYCVMLHSDGTMTDMTHALQHSATAQPADDQAWDRNAERLTRGAGLAGGRVNPNATSMDDLFVDDEPASAQPAGDVLGPQRWSKEAEMMESWSANPDLVPASAQPVAAAPRLPEQSRASRIECALRQIVEADDNQVLTQSLIESARSALATPVVDTAPAITPELTAEQIEAGADVLSDDTGKPIGRNVAIMVADAMLAAAPAAPVAQADDAPTDVRLVFDEVARATRKFPTWPTDPLHAVAVLGEEFGELTKAALQTTYEPHKVKDGELRTEAIQTAAMALRFVASLGRYEFTRCAQHEQPAMSAQQGQEGGA